MAPLDKALKFKPWVSENYTNLTSKFGKVLILGESHYGSEKDKHENFTIQVVLEVINGKYCAGYRHFTLLGRLFNPDRNEIFKNCAFANLIQDILSEPGENPTKSQIETIVPAFWAILNEVKPDKVIITSTRLWENWMPDDDKRCSRIGELKESGKFSTIWEYSYNQGKCIAIGINHTRARDFYSWRPLVEKFIKEGN